MPAKGEVTRSQILQAAYTLFLDKGYTATSMRDVVAASGITMGGIYNHFSSKEEIFSAIFAENNLIARVLPLLMQAEGDSLESLVRDAARRMVTGLGQSPDGLKLTFIEIVEFKGRHFSEAFEAAFPQVMQLAGGFLRFQEQLRELPPQVLARSFMGLFFSYFMTELILPGRFTAQQDHLDQFINIYLHGILEPQ